MPVPTWLGSPVVLMPRKTRPPAPVIGLVETVMVPAPPKTTVPPVAPPAALEISTPPVRVRLLVATALGAERSPDMIVVAPLLSFCAMGRFVDCGVALLKLMVDESTAPSPRTMVALFGIFIAEAECAGRTDVGERVDVLIAADD